MVRRRRVGENKPLHHFIYDWRRAIYDTRVIPAANRRLMRDRRANRVRRNPKSSIPNR